jgi:hypothetical protein
MIAEINEVISMSSKLKHEAKLAATRSICHILQHKIPYLIKAGMNDGINGIAYELFYSAGRWGTSYVFDRLYKNIKGENK